MPTLGILEDEDSPLPLLQGPEPFMWPNQSGQELGAAEPQLPASFPSPHGGKLGPSGLSLHRGGTAPILPSAPAQGSLTARDGAVGMGVQPSLPYSRLFPLPFPVPIFPVPWDIFPVPTAFPVPGWHTSTVLQPSPECHRKRHLSFPCLFSRLRSDRLFLNARGNC